MITQTSKKETVTKVSISIVLESAEEVELFNKVLDNAAFEARRRTVFPSDEPMMSMIEKLQSLIK